jgi:hypothetical protein
LDHGNGFLVFILSNANVQTVIYRSLIFQKICLTEGSYQFINSGILLGKNETVISIDDNDAFSAEV